MPGLIGFMRKGGCEDCEVLLTAMSEVLRDEDWYQADLYCDNSTDLVVGLGRVSIGLMNPEPQPIWNQDRTACIVMEGELYGCESKKQDLVAKGYKFALHNDAELILNLYEQYGDDFVTELNGAFIVAVWDRRTRKLIVANDRLGLRPLYYAEYSGHFAFSSGVRALLADPTLPRKIDLVGIAQAMSFEYLLGDRTLLSTVQLLSPASILKFQDGHCTTRQYWELRFVEFGKLLSSEEYVEGLIFYLRQAMARQANDKLTVGVNLSGGLDSRMIVGLLNDCNVAGSVRTYTWGDPRCTDAQIAQEVASVIGSEHHLLSLTPERFREAATNGIRLVDGMTSCYHMHAFANVRYQARAIRLIYSGFFIDSLISPDLRPEWMATISDDSAYHILLADIDQLFTADQKKDLYTDSFLSETSAEFHDSFRASALQSKSTILANWQNNFEIRQRLRRFTQNGDELLRSQVICRTPFCDKDLVDFCLALPPGLRMNRHLFIEAFKRYFHDLAKIPWSKTLMPVTPSASSIRLQAEDLVRWHLRNRLHMKFIHDSRRMRPYDEDYADWMRDPLRGWLEEMLRSKVALERGYFNPKTIIELLDSHMEGRNYSRQLAMMVSLEMWHREFIDKQ